MHLDQISGLIPKEKKLCVSFQEIMDGINEEWLSDKSRFIWDGLNKQRLDAPYIKNEEGKLKVSSWMKHLML